MKKHDEPDTGAETATIFTLSYELGWCRVEERDGFVRREDAEAEALCQDLALDRNSSRNLTDKRVQTVVYADEQTVWSLGKGYAGNLRSDPCSYPRPNGFTAAQLRWLRSGPKFFDALNFGLEAVSRVVFQPDSDQSHQAEQIDAACLWGPEELVQQWIGDRKVILVSKDALAVATERAKAGDASGWWKLFASKKQEKANGAA